MRSLVLVLVAVLGASCDASDPPRPSLDGPVECEWLTCTSGQVCVVQTAGSQCDVNEDAGIGQYDVIQATCVDLPDECDGVPSCECLGGYGSGMCFGVSTDGRRVTTGCI
jgi:hypothetical protein